MRNIAGKLLMDRNALRHYWKASLKDMIMTGKLWHEYPDLYLQSHISENLNEIKWVKNLYPNCRDYLDIYQRYNQTGNE